MNVSDYFNLNLTQRQLDFVDVYIDDDIALFVDPSAFFKYDDPWSSECHSIIREYFQYLVEQIRSGNELKAIAQLSFLSEPKETHLGFGQRNFKGRGIGGLQAQYLFNQLKGSRAVITGFITDLADCELMVPGISFDKISDMTTNIIRQCLIKYTQEQCKLFDIPMENVAAGFMWDSSQKKWYNNYVDLPLINNTQLILVPKKVVVWKPEISSNEFYNFDVLEYLQGVHLSANSALVETLKNKKKIVTKKTLKEQPEYRFSKEFIYEFCNNHPEILDAYKKRKQQQGIRNSMSDSDLISEISEAEVADVLINQLKNIKAGNDNASEFHKYCIGALEFLFFPTLNNPQKEREIHDGRKRIDIVFSNNAPGGFFYEMRTTPSTHAAMIIIECKNYSYDPANPELDQIAGRFSPLRGQFGIIIARHFNNRPLFINRCIDTAKDQRGIIIPISDDDIIKMLNAVINDQRRDIENQLREIYMEIIS